MTDEDVRVLADIKVIGEKGVRKEKWVKEAP
jgi:hypothetical protein